jgi:SAM-dependent MidA family methyltransferase
MNSGNPDLIRFIRTEIKKRGPQSFAWFMQQTLYHPEHGYYSSGRCAIGRQGDYFTNVSVGPLFGRLLGVQFAEIWERLGRPDDFVIVEQGAHDGQFARDVLESLQKRAPEFFEVLRYQIVESFPILRERQSQTLESFRDKIEWRDSLQRFVGIHFSNELLDAMPMRLISKGREKFVAVDGDKFVFVEQTVHDEANFNQAVLGWIDSVAANLQRGYVITIDYGHLGGKFHENIQVRAQHRNLDSPFEQIGHADITLGVDWPSVADRAQSNGMRVAGFTDQHHFLTGIISESLDLTPEGDAKLKRELQTLLHPEMLGRTFQALGLSKNVDLNAPPLAGFKFAGEPRSVLGVS